MLLVPFRSDWNDRKIPYQQAKRNEMPPCSTSGRIPDHTGPFRQNRLVFKLRPIWKLFCTQTQYTQTLIILLLSLFFLLRLSLASVTFFCCFLVSREREREAIWAKSNEESFFSFKSMYCLPLFGSPACLSTCQTCCEFFFFFFYFR